MTPGPPESTDVGGPASGPRTIASILFGLALLALGVLALLGFVVPGVSRHKLPGEGFVGATLVLCGVSVLLPRPAWAVAIGATLGVAALLGSAGFHAQAVFAGRPPTQCGCLAVLGPLTHGWYLVLCSTVALLGVLACAHRITGVAERWRVLPVLVAVLAGWLVGAVMPRASGSLGADTALRRDAPYQPRLELRTAQPARAEPRTEAGPPSAQTTPATLTVVITHEEVLEPGTVVRVAGLDRDDGTLWRRDVTISGASTTAEIVGGAAGTAEALSDTALAESMSVALERPGAPVAVAAVTWTLEPPRQGRAQVHVTQAPGIDLQGTAVNGLGAPVPDLELALAGNPTAVLVSTLEGRVRGARLGVSGLLTRTDAAGRFRVSGWSGGERVFVRVATAGWARVDDDTTQTSFAASRADGVPFLVAEGTRATYAATTMRVVVGEVLFVPVKVVVPPLPPESVGGESNWLTIDPRTTLGKPGIRVQPMGWSSTGSMPLPLPAGVHLYTTSVALESTTHLDTAVERGVGVARFPGCEPVTFPFRWQTLARLDPPEVRLVPREPGEPSHVRFQLDGAPASLLDVTGEFSSSWAKVRDIQGNVDSPDAHVWERGLRLSNGRLEGLVLYPGHYEVELGIADGSRIQVPAGRVVDLRVPCRPLAGLDIRLAASLGGDSNFSVWVTRLKAGETAPKPEHVEAPVVGSDGTIGLRVAAQAGSPDRRRFWFLNESPRVLVTVYSTRGGPYAKEVQLSTGDTQKVSIP